MLETMETGSIAERAGAHNGENDMAIRVRHRRRPVSPESAAPIVADLANGDAELGENAPEGPSDGFEDDASTVRRAGEAGYAIGYGKPPERTRFKKGQSGNPKGQPKGAKSPKTVVRKLLGTKMSVKIDGKTQSLTTLEIALQQQLKRAMNGDRKALEFLAAHLPEETEPEHGISVESNTLNDNERAMLIHHQRERLTSLGLDDGQIVGVLASLGLAEMGEAAS